LAVVFGAESESETNPVPSGYAPSTTFHVEHARFYGDTQTVPSDPKLLRSATDDEDDVSNANANQGRGLFHASSSLGGTSINDSFAVFVDDTDSVRCVNATSVAQRNNVNHDTSSMAQDFFYATGEPAETQPFCITSGEYEVESISGGGTCSGVESTSERSEIVRSDKYGGALEWRRRISNSSVTMGCRCSSNTTRSDVQRNVGAEAERSISSSENAASAAASPPAPAPAPAAAETAAAETAAAETAAAETAAAETAAARCNTAASPSAASKNHPATAISAGTAGTDSAA